MVPRLARTIGSVTSSQRPPRPAAYAPGRLVVTALVVLALMAVGLVAGRWQWGRYETRSQAKADYEAAQGLPTAPLTSMLTAVDTAPGSASWRTATVTGVIDEQSMVALRGRSLDDTATLQYLSWIHTAQGESVLLNLGWVPRSGGQPPTIPAGEVTVTGTVRALEAVNGRPGTRISPAQMGAVDGAALQAYLMVETACGASGCVEGVEPVPVPELSLGPHLSYALQWWLLSVGAGPVAVVLTRRDASHERVRAAAAAGAEEGQAPTGAPAKKSTRPKRLTDEEIEDAL